MKNKSKYESSLYSRYLSRLSLGVHGKPGKARTRTYIILIVVLLFIIHYVLLIPIPFIFGNLILFPILLFHFFACLLILLLKLIFVCCERFKIRPRTLFLISVPYFYFSLFLWKCCSLSILLWVSLLIYLSLFNLVHRITRVLTKWWLILMGMYRTWALLNLLQLFFQWGIL